MRGIALIALTVLMSLFACGCRMPVWPNGAAPVNDPFAQQTAVEPSVEIVETNPAEFGSGL